MTNSANEFAYSFLGSTPSDGTLYPNINAFYVNPDTGAIWSDTSTALTYILTLLGAGTDTSLLPLGLTILVNDSSDYNKQKEYWRYKDDNI